MSRSKDMTKATPPVNKYFSKGRSIKFSWVLPAGLGGMKGESRRCKIATGRFNAQSCLPANAILPTYLSIRYAFQLFITLVFPYLVMSLGGCDC